MLRVATVLSAREWEARLVASARDSALVKLVLRAFLPDEVTSQADGIDVVVAGAETPWVTATRVAAWRRLGLRVVGLHAPSDRPAAERLEAGGADLVMCDDLDADLIVREIRLLDVESRELEARSGRLIAVTGVPGAPGVTEVAVAIAWNEAGGGQSVLLDGNLAAPSVAVRLGLSPRPDLVDLIDASLGSAVPSIDPFPRLGRLSVVPGALRSRDPGIRSDAVVDVVVALATDHTVVADSGTWPNSGAVLREADAAVVVASGTPTSIVRLARLAEGWTGPTPHLVINGVALSRSADVVAAARRWSGLEPFAVIPRSRRVLSAASTGIAPAGTLRRRLVGVGRSNGD